MRTPEFEQRLNAHLLAHLQCFAVVTRGIIETDAGGAVVSRWHGDALATDLCHLVHVDLERLHRRSPARVVVIEKRRERDGVFNGETGIGDPLAEILERAAAGRVSVDLLEPGLDGMEPRL